MKKKEAAEILKIIAGVESLCRRGRGYDVAGGDVRAIGVAAFKAIGRFRVYDEGPMFSSYIWRSPRGHVYGYSSGEEEKWLPGLNEAVTMELVAGKLSLEWKKAPNGRFAEATLPGGTKGAGPDNLQAITNAAVKRALAPKIR